MSELTYEVTIPNENEEELGLSFDEKRVCLTIPRFEATPAKHIYLTHAELENIYTIFQNYKSMLELKVA